MLAREMGYEEISFFGCDSSFGDRTHAYMDESYLSFMKVRCAGQIYDTCLPLLYQALCLAEVMREAPEFFRCCSGGLLAALVSDPDYEAVAVRRSTYENLLTEDGRPFHEIHSAALYQE